jgi:hypothetical protein
MLGPYLNKQLRDLAKISEQYEVSLHPVEARPGQIPRAL